MNGLEDIEVSGSHFEPTASANGYNSDKILDSYPDPENTFDVMSNGEGDGKVSGTDIAGAVEGVAAVASLFAKSDQKKALKDVCGRKPLTKKNQEKKGWTACSQKFYTDMMLAQAPKSYAPPAYIPPAGDNNQGMSTGAKWGIGIGITAVVLTIGFFAIKKMRSGKVVVPA